jgi:hypothetical protein
LTVWVKSLILRRNRRFSMWIWLRCSSITDRIGRSVLKSRDNQLGLFLCREVQNELFRKGLESTF